MAVALTGIMPAAAADSPAGHLPTHLLIAPGDDAWSGRLRALQFAPTLGTLEAPLPPDLWEASRLLDTLPPDARQLWTFGHGHTPARTAIPLRWAALDPAQQAALDAPHGNGAIRLDYLRGARTHETQPPRLRPRTSVLGAMRGTRVQLLGPPGFAFDARHAAFRQQAARRPWMVYLGANDGMLHGFDALTGQERFAVMSDAVLPVAARDASPGQSPPAPVCRRPFAADAWTGTRWHSILACANGAMAPGLFLVDVSDPASTAPRALLAYDATDDPTVGHLEDPIPIVPLADDSGIQSRWFAISGNGRSDASVESRLLLLALDQPPASAWQPGRTAFTIAVPKDASVGGLGAPAVALGPDGRATFAYAGDTHGQIWRFDLRGAPPWPQALGRNETERRQPFFTAKSQRGQLQHIVGPILLAATAGGPLLVFTAVDADGSATLYGVADRDNGQRNLSRSDLAGRSAADVAEGVVLRPDSDGTPAKGWHIDLPPGHTPDDLTSAGSGSLLLTTRDADGLIRAYLLDPRNGLPADKGRRTGHVLASAPLITTQAAPPNARQDGSSTQVVQTTLWHAPGNQPKALQTYTQTRKLGRLSWRELIEEGAR
jgi:type IV pilus assembly protein PilY1